MTRYLTLAEVARRTGRHPEQLRQWCASGRLPCDRFGRDWLLSESDLGLVDQVAARRRRAGTASRTVLGVSFTDEGAGRRALSAAREQFGLGPRDVGLAPLAIDDVAFVLVAVVVPEERVADAASLFEGSGGTVVAEVPQRGRGRGDGDAPARRRDEGAAGGGG